MILPFKEVRQEAKKKGQVHPLKTHSPRLMYDLSLSSEVWEQLNCNNISVETFTFPARLAATLLIALFP